MDISKARCPDCEKPMKLTAATCTSCGLKLEGDFEVSPLGRLSEEDQVFVVAFLRHHGSIRQMERILDISYPTVKNRLRAIVARLDETFTAPSPNAVVLEQLSRGEITVDEALERLEE
jgi:hypothetical protein